MQTPALVDPADTFLEQQRSRPVAGHVLAETDRQPKESLPVARVQMVPEAIEVEFWREDDNTWTAHSPLLGVTAVADTEAELFAEAAEVVDEFWQLLNEKYSTLSDDLRNLLDLRFQTLRFTPRI